MDDGGRSGTFELRLAPRTERFDADDDRWREQVSQLFQELQHEVGGVTRRQQPVEGSKGGFDTVILALGSAGAFTAGLDMLRAWLGRDRSRKLDITYTVDERTETVSITGDAIDKDSMARITQAVASRLERAPWTGTEPS